MGTHQRFAVHFEGVYQGLELNRGEKEKEKALELKLSRYTLLRSNLETRGRPGKQE